jgi:hypothetical protein
MGQVQLGFGPITNSSVIASAVYIKNPRKEGDATTNKFCKTADID